MRAADFIENQYQKIRLLKKSERGEVWLTTDQQGKLAIYRQSQQPNLPLSELKTANISLLPQIYYIASDNSGTTCIEEYIHGQSLADRKKMQNFLTEREARKILLALSHGLAKLHDLGIIHRDIKPEHILIEKDDTPRLIDFDTCRRFKDGKAEDTTLLGTKTYAPPEQFGFQQTDQRSDIYSLGVTISELLPPDYQGTLRPILNRCSRLDPADRYQNMIELSNALQKPRILYRSLLSGLLTIILILAGYAYTHQPAPQAPITNDEPAATDTTTTPPTETIGNTSATIQNNQVTPAANQPQPIPTTSSSPPPQPEPAAPAVSHDEHIRVQYFHNGSRLDGWTEKFNIPINNACTGLSIPRAYWQDNMNNQGILHMYSEENISLHIINKSIHPWQNAHLILHYQSGTQNKTTTLSIADLAPGAATDITIPLSAYPISNPDQTVNSTVAELSLDISSSSPQEIRNSRHKISIDFAP